MRYSLYIYIYIYIYNLTSEDDKKVVINAMVDISVGDKKVSSPTNKIYVWLGGLNRNSTIGLIHGPKAIGEDPKNSLYFMPWA